MNDDYEDARRDEYFEKLRAEWTPEVIEEFKSERILSYFESNRTIAEKPYLALVNARKLQSDGHETAAFVFAVVASEVTIKSVFIHPLVIGVVHNDVVAPIVTNMVMERTRGQFARIEDLFLSVLRETTGIDLESYWRTGAIKPLLKEVFEIQRKRNRILHEAEMATKDDTKYAIDVATEILERVFPKVADSLGYHIHDRFRLCRNWRCMQPEAVRKMIEGKE